MDEHGRRSLEAPRRLSQGDPASLETRLVRAARADAPPPGASGRAMAALGLGAAAATSVAAGSAAASTTTASTAAASTAAASTAAASTAAASTAAKGFLGAGLSTWLAGGAIVVAATGGVLALDATSSRAPTSPVASAAPSSAIPRVEARSPVHVVDPRPITSTSATADEASPDANPRGFAVPTVAAPSVAAPRASASPVASASAGPSTLSHEVELIDGARSALAEGDPARALTTLDRYDREHPGGVLAPEAALLRTKARAKIDRAP